MATTRRALGTALTAFVALSSLPLQAAADGWLVTVADGEAIVVDGLRRVAAVPGLKLASGAIVETGGRTNLLRIENADQVSVDLAADTRALIAPMSIGARGDRAPQLYLLQGFVKVAARGGAAAPGIVTPDVELLPLKGSAVLQAGLREFSLFAESGRAEIVERRAAGAGAKPATQAVNAGEFYASESQRRGTVSPRPAPGWLQKVPRAFRDPIPLRAAALRDRRVEPPVLPGPTYAQLADWLSAAEPALRREFVTRFAPLARDPAFRAEVRAHLKAHPEWSPVVNPPPRRTAPQEARP